MAESKVPTGKVAAATAAAAAVTVAAYVASLFGISVPAEVQGAVTTLAVFAAGYIKA